MPRIDSAIRRHVSAANTYNHVNGHSFYHKDRRQYTHSRISSDLMDALGEMHECRCLQLNAVRVADRQIAHETDEMITSSSQAIVVAFVQL
jgi:hypothetical protein